MNPPPIDPYAGRRKQMAWLMVAGALGWQLLFCLITVVGTAIFPTVSRNVVMALALVVSTIFAFRCMFISLKFEQEHPILKKRTSPLKSSQFALAPMDARLQLKNDRDKAKFFLFAFFIVVCLLEVIRGLMSPSPNMRVVNSFYILLVLQLLMGFIALRNLRHYPLGFEAVANAEGLTIHRMRRQPEHFTWYEIQEASLVERFTNWGERASLSLVLLSANDGK